MKNPLAFPGRNWHDMARKLYAQTAKILFSFPKEAETFKAMGEQRGRWLLHISDTPATFFRSLRRLCGFLRPYAIVHTGDMVDEVKLELHPGDLNIYTRRLKRLGAFLDSTKTYITLGNHDHLKTVRQVFSKSTIFPRKGVFLLGDLRVGVSHYLSDLSQEEADLCLYGHDDSLPPKEPSRTYHNGLLEILCYNLDTGEARFFAYPWYVAEGRSRRSSMGL